MIKNVIKIKEGGIWEESEFYILFNHKFESKYYAKCRHCISEGEYFICPKVIKAMNEGGFNNTGVCADCIVEALKV